MEVMSSVVRDEEKSGIVQDRETKFKRRMISPTWWHLESVWTDEVEIERKTKYVRVSEGQSTLVGISTHSNSIENLYMQR